MIAALLLVVMAIALAAALYTWTHVNTLIAQEVGGKKASEISRSLSGELKIISLENRSGSIYIVVYNSGRIPLHNLTFYVNGRLDGNLSEIFPNEIAEVKLKSISSPGEYKLSVASAEGVSYSCTKEL